MHLVKQAAIYLIVIQIATLGIFKGGIFAELCLLPNMLEHYDEHYKEANGDLDVLEFIRLHYFNHDHPSSDPSHHTGLPLGNHGGSFAGQILHIDDTLDQCFLPMSELLEKTYLVWPCGGMMQTIHLTPFQPPELV
jgi:hypothetical protein